MRGSWLEKYEWFQVRRLRHFHHHRHLRQNMSLGGIDPTFDIFFGTFIAAELDAAAAAAAGEGGAEGAAGGCSSKATPTLS